MKYCLGFIHENYTKNILLIRKNRPSWQAGFLNGVGGKVELGETSKEAMSRETEEETGFQIPIDNWNLFATLQEKDKFKIDVFNIFVDNLSEFEQKTDEKLEIHEWDKLSKELYIIQNLLWLIPLGLYSLSNKIDIVEVNY